MRASSFLLVRLVAAAIALPLPLLSGGCKQEVRRPHVVLFVLDALRARNLGCYGYSGATSPVIDSLAADGVLFEQAISVGGNTAATMPAIFTGRYSFFETDYHWGEANSGMHRFRERPGSIGLPESMTTVAEYLSAVGYRTAGFVTNPFLKTEFHMDQGFKHYEEIFDESGAPGHAGQVVRRVRQFSVGVDWSQPTFIFIHLMDTHAPYRSPDARLRASLAGETETFGGMDPLELWMNLENVPPGEQKPLHRYWSAIYDASIRRADGAIGRILRHIQDQQTTRGTLVVLTADHGDEFLEHGGTLHKATLFDEIVHVPLLIRVPGGSRGLRRKELVRNFDVTPTILDYAGVPTAARHMDAVSLRPALEGRSFKGPGEVYAGFPSKRMLRTERYKLLRYPDGREAFYDLQRDPGEQHDLSSTGDQESQQAQAALARRLDQIVETLRGQGTSPTDQSQDTKVDARTREQLKALGYIEE